MLGWFRRHATILMVVLGSGAMVIFGLGPVFDSFSRPSTTSTSENVVLASWKGGKISRSDLSQFYQRHAESQRFLQAVIDAAAKKSGDQIFPLAQRIPPIQEGRQEAIDEQVMERMMYAAHGQDEGIVVSDGMVDDYLVMISADAGFSNLDLEQINRSVNNCSLLVVKDHLKTELQYNLMRNFTFTSMYLPPNPTEAMQLYARTAEQIECEVLPVIVDQFLSKVSGEPTEAEIKALYNEGKLEYPDGEGKKPGFKIGRQVNVQYLVANLDTFLQNEMNKLTDEQVQKKYDELVAEKSFLVMEPIAADNSFQMNQPPPTLPGGNDPAPAPPGDGQAPDGVDKPPMQDDPATTEGQPKTDPPAEPAKLDGPAKTENGGEPKAADSAPNTDPPAKTDPAATPKTDPPAATDPAATPKTDPPATTESGGGEPEKSGAGSTNEEGGNGNVQLIQQAAWNYVSTGVPQDPEKPQDPPQATDATQKPASETPPATQDPVPTPPAAEPPAVAPVQDPPLVPETTVPATEAAPQDGDIPQPPATLVDSAPEQKVKPLKDVVGDIKRQMALEPARKAMEEALAEAEVTVQNYFQGRLEWEYADSGEEAPKPFDTQQLAAKHNLEARETGLVDQLEIRKDELGGIFLQSFYVGDVIFGQYDQKELYNSESFGGLFNVPNQYLFWLTEKVDARIPELKECRDQVIAFWKKRKARELALAEAESIAAKVNASGGKKLSELYAETTLPTGAFTWFNSRQGATLSQPFNVEDAGDAFMSTAFSMKENQAGVAPNRGGEIVYVVQSLTGQRPVSELGNDYLKNQFWTFKDVPADVRRAAQYYSQESQQVMADNLRESLRFKRLD